jgi:hypothetical protein
MIERYLVCTYNVLVGNLGHVRQGLLLIVARRVVVVVREEEQGLQGGDLLEVWLVGRGSFWSRYVVLLGSFKRLLHRPIHLL